METIVINQLLYCFIYGCIGGLVIISPYIIYVQIAHRRKLKEWSKMTEIKKREIERIVQLYDQKIMKKGCSLSYIEVQLIDGGFVNWNFVPGMGENMHIGDKIVINRNRISGPNYMHGIFSEPTRKGFIIDEKRYFSSSNLCFVQITEKIYHETHVEFHGKIVPKDGVFYSN